MSSGWQVAVAIYAAVVATGALFLEIRRWFEGRPRLIVGASPEMMTIDATGIEDGPYVIVTVTNRGFTPTTVTHFGLLEYASWWRRIRGKHGQAAIITNPTIPGSSMGQLPSILEPGRQWMGAINQDEVQEWMDTGRFHIAIYATHSDRPALTPLKRKPELPKALKDAEEQ